MKFPFLQLPHPFRTKLHPRPKSPIALAILFCLVAAAPIHSRTLATDGEETVQTPDEPDQLYPAPDDQPGKPKSGNKKSGEKKQKKPKNPKKAEHPHKTEFPGKKHSGWPFPFPGPCPHQKPLMQQAEWPKKWPKIWPFQWQHHYSWRQEGQQTESVRTNALILFDSGSDGTSTGEDYARHAAFLVSYMGTYTAMPVQNYTKGMLRQYPTTLYIGSTWNEPLPKAFLSDVRQTNNQIIWLYHNIWQLTNMDKTFQRTRGWTWTDFESKPFGTVRYGDTDLNRNITRNTSALMGINVFNHQLATVLATARKTNGAKTPWAVNSGNFTYIAEIPFNHIGENDRYLAFADILRTVLAHQPTAMDEETEREDRGAKDGKTEEEGKEE